MKKISRSHKLSKLESFGGDGNRNEREEAILIEVQAVAAMLSCSERSVWRMADRGKMPAAIRLGRIVRWRRDVIMEWIEDGCPVVEQSEGGE